MIRSSWLTITSLLKSVSRFPYCLVARCLFSFFVVTVPVMGVKKRTHGRKINAGSSDHSCRNFLFALMQNFSHVHVIKSI